MSTRIAPRSKSASSKEERARPARKDAAWAVEAMSDWLASPMEFGERPADCEVVFQKKLPWFGGGPEICFLVRYRMRDRKEFIGFTGPITWSFLGVPMSEVDAVASSSRYQALVNLYYGWYAAFASAQRKGAPPKPNQKKLAGMIRTYQRGPGHLIPVNLKLRDYAKIGRNEYHVLEGSVVYADDSDIPLPKRGKLEGIEIAAKGQPGFHGESDCFILFRNDAKWDFDSMARDRPLIGRLPLYFWIGKDLGPFRY